MSARRPVGGLLQLPENVVDLAQYRSARGGDSRRSILYLSNQEEWLSVLQTVAPRLRSVTSPDALSMQPPPDLVIIESWIEWADAIDLVERLVDLHAIPVLMLWNLPRSHAKTRRAMKRAFAAGVADSLFTPLNRAELEETLDVLLKLQRQHSLYH